MPALDILSGSNERAKLWGEFPGGRTPLNG